MAKNKTNPEVETTEQDTQEIKDTGFKKLSVNTLDPIMKDIIDEVELSVGVGKSPAADNCIKFKAKCFLTTQATLQFVRNVVDTCVINSIYFPALFDFAFKSTFLEIATNIKLPNNINRANSFIYGSNVFDVLDDNEEISYLMARLRIACNEQVEFITKKSKADDLLDMIMDVVANFSTQFEGMDIKGLADKLSGIGKIDEQKLADAVLGKQNNGGKVVEFPVEE